jgi:hypothetical protein
MVKTYKKKHAYNERHLNDSSEYWRRRVRRRIVLMLIVTIFLMVSFFIIRKVDIRTGKLLKPRVLYGSVEDGMSSAKAAARANYHNKSQRSGILKPIPDNVHDLLFFSVTQGNAKKLVIVAYNPWYPFWAGAAFVDFVPPYEKLDAEFSEAEYMEYKNYVKCMIVGNGLFSRRLDDFEIWYFEGAN